MNNEPVINFTQYVSNILYSEWFNMYTYNALGFRISRVFATHEPDDANHYGTFYIASIVMLNNLYLQN